MSNIGVDRPFAPACERNQEPILNQLREILIEGDHVLEIGSGTGQHAVYMTTHLPQINWTTSDLLNNHDGIKQWILSTSSQRILGPKEYESKKTALPIEQENIVFTANTLHIMGPSYVQQLIDDIANAPTVEKFITYGPFNYNGTFTSESNAKFNIWLQETFPEGGIRDFEWIQSELASKGFSLDRDIEMPANNRLIVFHRV